MKLIKNIFMLFGVIGFSFQTLSLKEREEKQRIFHQLFARQKGVFLSTCNRCEFYFCPEEKEALSKSFKELFFCYQLQGLPAFLHLVRVTAGLESLLLGETEIHRQVKESYQKSKEGLRGSLHYFFQKALHIAKEIRNYFPEMQSPSMGRIIAEFLPKPYGKKQFAFVGKSRLNLQIGAFFSKQGINTPAIYTRHLAKQACLPSASFCWKPWEQKKEALQADILICASKVQMPLFYPQHVSLQKPLWIFDLGVPRNVCPEMEKVPGIQLFNIDTLSKTWNLRWKQALLQKQQAEQFLQEKAERLFFLYQKKRQERLSHCSA